MDRPKCCALLDEALAADLDGVQGRKAYSAALSGALNAATGELPGPEVVLPSAY
jgi:hypothetical protein